MSETMTTSEAAKKLTEARDLIQEVREAALANDARHIAGYLAGAVDILTSNIEVTDLTTRLLGASR